MSVETSYNKAEGSGDIVDMEPLSETVRQITLPEHLGGWIDDLELPPGYGLIGGAARSLATELLLGHTLPVRDIDIIAFSEYNPDRSFLHEVSARLMPDDYTFGHGVQFSSLSNYFSSRDFTIKQVAVVNQKLLVTNRAEQDLCNNAIRPTTFEHDPDNKWLLSPRLAIKAVLLQAVLEQSTGSPSTVEGVDLTDYVCDITDESE